VIAPSSSSEISTEAEVAKARVAISNKIDWNLIFQ
jgi:hypothetical protein